MATVTQSTRDWLGKDADTPQGQAYDAVQHGAYTVLRAVLDEHGRAATLPAQGPIRAPGHPAHRGGSARRHARV